MKEQYLEQATIDALKFLIEQHGTWGKAKPHAKSILSLLDWTPTTQEIYDAVNNIGVEDRVAPCGKEKKFFGFWGGYKFCGTLLHCKCAIENTKTKSEITFHEKYGCKRPMQNASIRAKTRETNIEKYGVSSPLKSKEIQQKIADTNVKKYGSANPMSCREIKEKVKATNLKRYGAEHVFQTEMMREKSANTMLKKYGVENYSKSELSKNNTKTHNLNTYGVEHYFQDDSFKKKTKETLIEKYGVDHLSKSKEIQQKIAKTNMERYGAPTPFQSSCIQKKAVEGSRNRSAESRLKSKVDILARYGRPISSLRIDQAAYDILSNPDRLQDFSKGKHIHTIAEELGVHHSTVLKRWHQHGFPISQSHYEQIIGEWLTDNNINYHKTRKIINGEIDFYLYDYNIAIEFNGIYWHSTKFKDKLYHRRKYEQCRDGNIRLVMINEDEWLSRSHIIKRHILHLIGQSNKGKSARKLSIAVISNKIANSFFDQHHIQGSTGTIKHAIGAFDNGILVGAMAFNHQRGTRKVELIRFCSDGDNHAGLFSRMFKNSVKIFSFDEVISFADLRYSDGNVYKCNEFMLLDEIKPDYRYVKGVKTFHKSSFTKSKISNKFKVDMNGVTEKDMMQSLGYLRIYDCGKLKFGWTNTS